MDPMDAYVQMRMRQEEAPEEAQHSIPGLDRLIVMLESIIDPNRGAIRTVGDTGVLGG